MEIIMNPVPLQREAQMPLQREDQVALQREVHMLPQRETMRSRCQREASTQERECRHHLRKNWRTWEPVSKKPSKQSKKRRLVKTAQSQ